MSRVKLFVRSLFVAGSWNYRDLLSVGLSWVLLPVTPGDRAIAPESGDATGGGHFNAHPYLVPLAVGVLARATKDGADASLLQRLKDALRAPLGSLGDQLIWGAWRPTCLVMAAIWVLIGAPPLATVLGLLVVYNAVSLGLGWWGITAGLSDGIEVARSLRRADLPTRAERAKAAGVLVFGGFIGVAAVEGADAGLGLVAFVVATLGLGLGFFTGGFIRRWVPLFVLLAVAIGLWASGMDGGGG